MDDLLEMVAGVWSDDPLLQLEATTNFIKILFNETLSTERVIESGVLPRFVEFLNKEDSPKLQYGAAWIIANISFYKPEVVIGLDAVPILIQNIASPNDDVPEKAIWALSNVACGSTENRDYVLNCGALIPLCIQLNKDTTEMSILRVGAATLLHFCHGTPRPPFDQVKPALPTLARLLHLNDEDVLLDASLALSDISGSDDGIQAVIEAGFVPLLVQIFQDNSPYVLAPVRGLICAIISTILSVDNHQIQCVIDGGALPILSNLLTEDNEKNIKMEACWMITNIAAGTEDQTQSVTDAKLVPILVNLAQNAEMEIKTRAAWAISSVAAGCYDDQVKYLVKDNCIEPLCDLLLCPDLKTIAVCLYGLQSILITGEMEKNTGEVNCYVQMIEDAKGLEKIENLQSYEDNEIKEIAVEIMETYWPKEEDEKTQQPPR